MKRIYFLALAVVSLLVVAGLYSATGSGDSEDAPRYNVVIISVDTLRYDRLGYYGYDRNTSPNIDRFARNNIVMKNTRTTAPYTPAAHASLFTSLPVRTHNVRRFATNEPSRLREEYKTMAEVLRGEGYQTFAAISNVNVGKRYNLDQGFQNFRTYRQPADLAYGAFSRFVDNGRNTNKPFFSFVHYNDPHIPYNKQKYTDRFVDQQANLSLRENVSYEELNSRSFTEKELEYISDSYDSEVRYVDEYFGKVIEKLKNEGIYNETVVVMTADHGESLGKRTFEKGIGHTRSLQDRVTKIPVIIHVPGEESRKIDHLNSITDIPVTVLESLGISYPDYYEGVNMLEEGRETVFAEDFTDFKKGEGSAMTGFWTSDRKVFYSDSKMSFFEVYESGSNPEKNISSEISNAERRKIKQKIFDWRASQESKKERIDKSKVKQDEVNRSEVKQRLRELGYTAK